MNRGFYKLGLTACAGLIFGALLSAQAAAASYKAEPIHIQSRCNFFGRMNNAAQLVGDCDGYGYYTEINAQKLHRIAKSIDISESRALGINDAGTVVGSLSLAGGFETFAWFKQPGKRLVVLGTLGGDLTRADAVNAAGAIAGSASIDFSGFQRHAFVVQAGGTNLVDIGSLGGRLIFPKGINGQGVVAGWGQLPQDGSSTPVRGFYAMPPDYKLVELPTFGGTFATVNALNENGVMVGGAQIPGGKFRAFVASTSGNSITDLGTPEGHGSVANAINDLGQVVGYDYVSEGDPHAFLCSGDCSDFVELNGVTTGLPKGVGLRDAYGITNTGKIIAQGTNARLYLLTPQ